ncbi:sperm associated antigen 8 [Astyanax mexicanus]|uniref:sperm associated antigen 8 n=1 Tax=Astyanax mexicanus TaxID=7994 RepID=UPI0020CB6841|nr:sperm associated antigen 8 [Astyanax mexicanus]XP_015457771.3 sperm associated antigen 8 [Astyanax mexicanus]
MNSSEVNVEKRAAGRSLLHNWLEERATELLDSSDSRSHINRHGHRGILTLDMTSKTQDETTVKATFTAPKGPGIRQKGLRAELLEKSLIKMISEQIHAELNPEPPAPELNSVTRADFTAGGFKPVRPAPSKECDYRSDQAITYWSENHQKIQGVTAVRTTQSPFKKNASFSTPISERLDDPMDFTL